MKLPAHVLFRTIPVGLLFFFTVHREACALGKTEALELSKLIHWLPPFACQDHKALKTCVLWTTEVCEAQVHKSLESCFKLNEKKINSHGPSLESWKEKLISCAERDAALRAKNQIIKSQLCANKGVTPL